MDLRYRYFLVVVHDVLLVKCLSMSQRISNVNDSKARRIHTLILYSLSTLVGLLVAVYLIKKKVNHMWSILLGITTQLIIHSIVVDICIYLNNIVYTIIMYLFIFFAIVTLLQVVDFCITT